MQSNPITPNVMTIGASNGTAGARSNRSTASATLALPSTPGVCDAVIGFPGPNNPTFDLSEAFEVTP